MRLSDAQIEDLKGRVDLAKLAGDFGAQLRRHGRNLMGSCPLCGGSKTTTRFEIKGDKWVCAACSEGGDALALVQKVKGLDFRRAVEFLGGAAVIDPAEEARLERERAERERQRAAIAAKMRADAIAGARRLWDQAEHFSRGEVEAYLRARGCRLPATAEVRGARAIPYFHGEVVDDFGRKSPRVLCRGPAMVSAVRDNAGAFVAVHLTYLNSDCSGKARMVDPDSGEVLPAKKQRGTKQGGHIVLRQGFYGDRSGVRQPLTQAHGPTRLFMGEGIETVLSVATALRAAGTLMPGDAFWSACDLGNLGGASVESVKHPTLKSKNGQAARVPGPVPDMSRPGILIPASVTQLFLLGDGDSDPFTTRMAMERASARYARDGLWIGTVWAPAGLDFNDILQGETEGCAA